MNAARYMITTLREEVKMWVMMIYLFFQRLQQISINYHYYHDFVDNEIEIQNNDNDDDD